MNLFERSLTHADAARLAALIESRSVTHPSERDDLDDLADTLAGARLLAPHELPPDVAALGDRVEMRLAGSDAPPPRSLVLCEPQHADPARGYVSIVSPLGRTLLGLRAGARASVTLPGGRDAEVELMAVDRARRAPTHGA